MANLNIPATKDRTLDAFKGRMVGGGARSNLFECEMYFPDDAVPTTTSKDALSDKVRFLVKAAQLPASTLTEIQVPFRGRQLKIAGTRTYANWQITVINDIDFDIRTAFERWSNLINKHEDNAGLVNPADYQQPMIVRQLGRSAVGGPVPTSDSQIPVLKMYQFIGAYPVEVSGIDLSYDQQDTIEEFTVNLAYQWYDTMDSLAQTQVGTGV
tara:strand:+ start:66 stop:701 length:636 start_codon:yes stop_codon:yes gene_type:complete